MLWNSRWMQRLYHLHHLAAGLRCYAWFLVAFDWFLIQSAADITAPIYSMHPTCTISCPNIPFGYFLSISYKNIICTSCFSLPALLIADEQELCSKEKFLFESKSEIQFQSPKNPCPCSLSIGYSPLHQILSEKKSSSASGKVQTFLKIVKFSF